MANPTTNYSFAMPTNTDLVKDLPADFEVFGQAVDTQMKTNADAAVVKSLLTTTGDTIYASGAATPARLGIGSTGNVLTVSGGVPTWAVPSSGSMTSLASGSLSGASVTLSSIASGYEHLYLRLNGVSLTVANNVRLQINGVATNYRSSAGSGNTAMVMGMDVGATNTNSSAAIWFYDYLKTSCYKVIQYTNYNNQDGTFSTNMGSGGTDSNTAVITSIAILANAGTFDAGTYQLFGVK
jgi:hypothetical protein